MADGENEREPVAPENVAATHAVTAQTVTPESVRVRRSPRYARFMIVGVVVCAIVAFVLTYSLPQGEGYDRNSVFGYMLLVSIAVGVTIGAIAALIAERITSRSVRTVAADRVDVVVAESDGPSELDEKADGDDPSRLDPSSDAAAPDLPQAADSAESADAGLERRDP